MRMSLYAKYSQRLRGFSLKDAHARSAALSAMSHLYDQGTFRSSVRHFTDLFKPRLVEIAIGDVDLSVRCACLQLCSMVDAHELFEPEEVGQLKQVIFSNEPKARSSVAPFVSRALLREAEGLHEACGQVKGLNSSSVERAARFKALARILSLPQADAEAPRAVEEATSGRIACAIEAIMKECEEFKDWQSPLKLLLKERSEDPQEDELHSTSHGLLALEREEEAALLEALPRILGTALEQQQNEAEGESFEGSATLPLLSAIPKLLARHRTDAPLVLSILRLISEVPISTLQEPAAIDDREQLLSELRGHFSRHGELEVLTAAVQGISRISKADGKTGDSEHLVSLSDEVLQSLRERSENRELETAALSENDVHDLSTMLKQLQALLAVSQVHQGMFDSSGETTSGWEIVHSIASRGRLGYDEESGVSAFATEHFEGSLIVYLYADGPRCFEGAWKLPGVGCSRRTYERP